MKSAPARRKAGFAAFGWILALSLPALLHARSNEPVPQPPGVHAGLAEVEGGKLFYEEAGSGPPIVLIHDGLLHREVWDAQLASFASAHRVIRYDRRGYGRSPAPEAPYSNIDDLSRLFDLLGIGKATLMGISSGGGLAIDFTLAHPEKVEMLVLVGAVVGGLGYSDHFFLRGGHYTADDRQSPVSRMAYWTGKDPYEIAPENEEARRKARRLLEENPRNLDDAKNALARRPDRPALPDLGKIAIPVLVLAGESDIPDVHAHAGAISAGIPGAARVVVPGAGHLVPLEKPEEFDAEVSRFMQEGRFLWLIEASGIEEAARFFEEGRKKDPAWTPLSEERMNLMARRQLVRGNTKAAIGLFRLNTIAHPGSWRAYDALAEGYLKLGDRESAAAAFGKSLEIEPGNENARKKLAGLDAE